LTGRPSSPRRFERLNTDEFTLTSQVPVEEPRPRVAVDVFNVALVPHSKKLPADTPFGLIVPFIWKQHFSLTPRPVVSR
jgi:hypothetical protein